MAPFHYEQRRLENDLITLEPFDPSIHTRSLAEIGKQHPSIFTYTAMPSFSSEEEFRTNLYDKYIAHSPAECLYAVIDKKTQQVAGMVGLVSTNPVNAVTEIAIVISPDFHRTYVSSNAVGLLLLYALDPPSKGGLGLRRVEWQCHADNEASRRTATRMGFELEGILRWHRVMPIGTEGVSLSVDALEKRNGTVGEMPGRHTAFFSIVWEEWEEKRPKVVAQMERSK
ncbi:hypothetical protein ASPZODRAFT_116956 [Penicilliopsis zonata CBS 506.65]|uniref:N-acetyltransferase domain-containing protein n=1 Tax=Penicilliopsis zonata CBS 506.65 TaxID=1073090 RepID=A0A1L9SH50_9EURO|nr:hypothetical protein ASPZODRAFT_116956 [Penicilliopsis zonata CBS 506.65]OJJ46437.1 hypothetical protein ASPZODRAFT_116956 [Penicilliopsis zonata CBS 506.65]